MTTALIGATPVAAQDWDYSATLYAWVPSLSATIDTRLGGVDIDPSGSDVLDSLDGAFMGFFTAQNGLLGFSADILYAGLGNDNATPLGLLFDDVSVQTDLAMVNVKGLYRVLEGPGGYLNLTGGLRWYDVSIDMDFNSGLLPNERVSLGDSWTDLTVGVSGYAPLSDDWFVVGSADVGGFGIGNSSELSWQAFGAVGYRFNETWSAELGYRYLSIEQEVDRFDVTLDMYGPVIGITARF
jgi:hypothetical protein